jgi:hypothetical protein
MTQPPAPAPAPSPAPAPAPAPSPAPAPPPPADSGFPANTPLEQMSGEQREAYWKHYARRHEDRVKQFGDLTPEQLKELREKAERHDALEAELATDAEKRAKQAADEADAKARAEMQPQLIAAKLETAAALAGVAEADLQAAVEFVDPTKFLDANGKVDADKVKTFVDKIKPATGNGKNPPKGPTVVGHGAGGPATPPAGSAKEKGLAEARRRGFGTPAPQPAGTTA